MSGTYTTTTEANLRQFFGDNGATVHDEGKIETIDSLESKARELDSQARVLRLKASTLKAEEQVKRAQEQVKRAEEQVKREVERMKREEERMKRVEECIIRMQTPSKVSFTSSNSFDEISRTPPPSFEGITPQDLFTQITNDDRILNIDSQPKEGFIEIIVQKPTGDKKRYFATVLTQKQLFEGHNMRVENRFNNGSGFTLWVCVTNFFGQLIEVYRFSTTQNTIDKVTGQMDQHF